MPNQFGEFLIPSVVSVDKDGRAVVGRIAQERLVTQPQDTVARFKRKMGTDAVYITWAGAASRRKRSPRAL